MTTFPDQVVELVWNSAKLLVRIEKVKRYLKRFWKDEEGAEIAEWVVVVALLVVVAVLIYNGVLKEELSSAVETIGDKISEAANL
jgi:Flp pilus assembly pilin Flp